MMTDHETKEIDDAVNIHEMNVSAYKIPTATHEADGTLEWDHTTLIIVEIDAGDRTGIGYTYADVSAALLIDRNFKKILKEKNVFDNTAITTFLSKHIRNNGTSGIAMMAVSAVDNALWDLKAKILDMPLCALLGKERDEVLIYGSGGFTNYDNRQLQQQFNEWEELGIRYLKLKVGTHPEEDVQRVRAARNAISKEAKIFVDANGAYAVKQALDKATQFSQYGVTWFEEPVASNNYEGLRFIKEHAPPLINIAAGEYGYNLPYFQSMLSANTVDVLQADATRCGGITGFIKAGHLAEAYQVPFSSHCAPSLHLHAALSLPSFCIAEYFFDHVRIEKMLFDGFPTPVNGCIKPDPERPGLGIEFKHSDAKKFKI